MNEDGSIPKNERRRSVIEQRLRAAVPQVSDEYGTCGPTNPCVGPVCGKWDRIGSKCSIRSIGEVATLWSLIELEPGEDPEESG